MFASRPSKENVFPPERLDWRDRRILEVVCKYGKQGQSFNKLAEEVKPFASRSTFALRIERLQRLKYLEKFPDVKRKQMKRIRGAFRTRLLMWMIAKAQKQIAEIEDLICEKEKLLNKPESFTSEETDDIRVFFQKTLTEKINNTFSSIAYVAAGHGEAAAGDIFLPQVTESFRRIVLRMSSFVMKNPAVAKMVLAPEGRASDKDTEELRRFFDEFGEEILENAPKHLRLKVEDLMKQPEKSRELALSLMKGA